MGQQRLEEQGVVEPREQEGQEGLQEEVVEQRQVGQLGMQLELEEHRELHFPHI